MTISSWIAWVHKYGLRTVNEILGGYLIISLVLGRLILLWGADNLKRIISHPKTSLKVQTAANTTTIVVKLGYKIFFDPKIDTKGQEISHCPKYEQFEKFCRFHLEIFWPSNFLTFAVIIFLTTKIEFFLVRSACWILNLLLFKNFRPSLN